MTTEKMPEKIRYRLVWNHARRLNRRGEGLVQVECQQGTRRIYFSTGIYLEPRHWNYGMVIDHELATDLNIILRRRRIDIERIELDYMKRDVRVTLPMLREAVKESTAPSAQLVDFGRAVIAASDRRDVTKANYRTLFNDLDKFRRGVRVDEVDYSFIGKYDQWLKDCGVQHNTRVGRLRLLRAVLNEAVRRDMLSRHTFASLLLQDGMPLSTVQKLLGHTKVTTTQIYAEVSDATILSDIAALTGKPQTRKRPKDKGAQWHPK